MADINIGAISEALNNKSDRDLRNIDAAAGADGVIDYQEPTAENGYTGYMKYATGRLICWGQLSTGGSGNKLITLPVEMAGTNYATIATRKSGGSTTTNVNVWARTPASSTTFNLYASDDTGVNWFAIGMAAN